MGAHASESDLLSPETEQRKRASLKSTPKTSLKPEPTISNRTPTNHVTRSAENLLDSAICDVNNDTPVPVTSRVSRSSTIRGAVSGVRAAATRSAESSPRHASPATSAQLTPAKRANVAVEVERGEADTAVDDAEEDEELAVDVVDESTPKAQPHHDK